MNRCNFLQMDRRSFLRSSLAAPFVITTSGVLMKVAAWHPPNWGGYIISGLGYNGAAKTEFVEGPIGDTWPPSTVFNVGDILTDIETIYGQKWPFYSFQRLGVLET